MDGICINMDDICILAEYFLHWLDAAPAPRVLFVGMTPVLQFYSNPAPHMEICLMESGSVEQLRLGDSTFALPQGQISLHNIHFGNHSPPKSVKGRAWCLIFDVSVVASNLEFLKERPVFSSTKARNPTEFIDVFRQMRRTCMRQGPPRERYVSNLAMFDPARLESGQGWVAWRVKALLMDFFSLLLDSATDANCSPLCPEAVDQALFLMEEKFNDPRLSLEAIARKVCLSPAHLGRIFKEHVGVAPMAYVQRLRLREAALRLQQTGQRIEQIADAVGYSDPLYFSKLFHREYGLSPRSFRNASFVSR